MPFLRRSPRVQAIPRPTVPRRSFFDRLLRPSGAVSRSNNITTTRKEPIFGRKKRSTIFGRRRRVVPFTESKNRSKPIIGQQRRPSLGDKIHGLGKKIAGSLTGHPRKKAAGTRMMKGIEGRGSRRRRFL
jgi:hypothetical protein